MSKAEKTLVDTITGIVGDYEKRTNQRLDFILRECGLDGIYGLNGRDEPTIHGHRVHPEAFADFLMVLEQNRKLKDENARLKEAIAGKIWEKL